MVDNTNIKMTTIPLLTNNFFIPTFNMDLPKRLLHPIALWTKNDVRKWIEYCMDEYALEDINLNDFEMNGKVLLLLNEDGFRQLSSRSGDILYKALQQHNKLIKSLNSQAFPFYFWDNAALFTQALNCHFDNTLLHVTPPPPVPPPSMPLITPTDYYMFHRPEDKYQTDFTNHQELLQIRQTPTFPLSSINETFDKYNIHSMILSNEKKYHDYKDVNSKQDGKRLSPSIKSSFSSLSPQYNESVSTKIRPKTYSRVKLQSNDTDRNNVTRKIHYYHDRIDFDGDILMKPIAAKNCRILWEFLYILLEDPHYGPIIHWENRDKMIFRIVQADKLAALWGLQKNRLSMTYEKLSRGMRYYYSNNIISKEQSKRLLYRFMRTPDEIRKTMKRYSDTVSIIRSKIDKNSSQSATNLHNEESSTEQSNRFFQLFSIYSPTYTSVMPEINSNDSPVFTKSHNSISKSDRSSSSSPESMVSNHDIDRQQTSMKHEHDIPILYHTHPSFKQSINLAVEKEDATLLNYEIQKCIPVLSNT